MRFVHPAHDASRAARRAQADQDLLQYLNTLNFASRNGQKRPVKSTTERLHEKAAADKYNQMVARLDTTFHALSDPTRRAMLAALATGERSIADLARPHAMSRTGAAKHVEMLERAGLVERRKAGREQLCRLRAAPLAEANAWLRQWERFWNERLDVLEALINADKEKAG
jgi:DNA-binding transcriptional ArsR family regulator